MRGWSKKSRRLHKTLGRSRLSYEAMESVMMDIERNLNNHPLTYVEAEGEEEVLTPNVIMWGRDAYPIEDIELIEDDKEKLTKMNKRLEEANAHPWRRWKRGYIHSLMEGHRLNKEGGTTPVVGEVVLVVGDEKNRGEWKKPIGDTRSGSQCSPARGEERLSAAEEPESADTCSSTGS